jgi:multimeric flavodoxin WrbA
MEVLALVGSPRKGGNTDILTDEFLRGASEAGAQVQEAHLGGVCVSAGERGAAARMPQVLRKARELDRRCMAEMRAQGHR